MAIFNNNEEQELREQYNRQVSQQQLKEAYTQHQIYNALNDDDKNDNLNLLLDNTNVLQEIELHLRGCIRVRNVETGKWETKKVYPAVMNDEGVQSVMQELTARVGKNAILSNIPEDKAGFIAFETYRVLSRLFMAYSDKFQLDMVKRTNVAYQVSDMIYFSLTRGIDGVERENAYKNRKSIDYKQLLNEDKKKGGIAAFFGS